MINRFQSFVVLSTCEIVGRPLAYRTPAMIITGFWGRQNDGELTFLGSRRPRTGVASHNVASLQKKTTSKHCSRFDPFSSGPEPSSVLWRFDLYWPSKVASQGLGVRKDQWKVAVHKPGQVQRLWGKGLSFRSKDLTRRTKASQHSLWTGTGYWAPGRSMRPC